MVSELEASHHDGRSFGRLFAVAEGGELAFPTPVYEIMNTFCQVRNWRAHSSALLKDDNIQLGTGINTDASWPLNSGIAELKSRFFLYDTM